MTELLPWVDAGAFAERLLGAPLWPHQIEVVRSPARYRVLCAGRQVGKSRLLAVEALHTAATRRNALVLIVSAGETAARRLLEECASLAEESDLLRGSVLTDDKTSLVLSNGSMIRAVPASMRQIRGWPVDLLIIDEAGFVDQEIWRAAEPSIIARPGSRVILSSTPWGGPEHFYRQLWLRGLSSPDEQVASWHWPSSVSPLVDQVLLEQIREREAPDYFAREYLAEWTDESGSYFAEAEIMAAVASYALIDPDDLVPEWVERARHPAAAGVDWGFAVDANAVALVALLDDQGLNDDRRGRLFVPWLEARYRWQWAQFIERICEICARYGVRVIASETNGVGAYPTDDLQDRLFRRAGLGTHVFPVVTDVRRKQSGFGKIKSLLQSGRLVLPNHPELLKQLRSLQFEQLGSGGMRIAVPERLGHDDLAMALMQAVSSVAPHALPLLERPAASYAGDVVTTTSGIRMPASPGVVHELSGFITIPEGRERGEGW